MPKQLKSMEVYASKSYLICLGVTEKYGIDKGRNDVANVANIRKEYLVKAPIPSIQRLTMLMMSFLCPKQIMQQFYME